LITDFDTKLIGGKARDYLNSLLIHTNSAPAYRHDKNGLAERHWQTLIAMARSWLASAELPGSFWFFAARRAAEICNYFPKKLDDGSWSTPLELAHHVKPDLRVLFKMFGVAAVRREHQGDHSLGKFETQSTPMIAVGRCQNSNALHFYNPANGTFVSSIDYKFQNNVTSGAFFGLKYQPGTFIYRLDESTTIFAPKFLLDSSVNVHTHSPPSVTKVIRIPTYNSPNVYTVSFKDGSIAEYTDDLLSTASSPLTTPKSLLPTWIRGGVNTTYSLITCPNLVMAPFNLIIMIGHFILANKILIMAYLYPILRLIVKIYWKLANFFAGMQNLGMLMIHVINYLYKSVSSVMSLPMDFNL
jgi:hypothetical protein